MSIFVDEFHTKSLNVFIDNKGGILVKVIAGKIITLDEIMPYFDYLESTVSKLNLQLPLPLCIDVSNAMAISSEMGDVLESKQHLHSAIAIINNHQDANKAANFLLRIETLPIPIEVFSKLEDGLLFIARFGSGANLTTQLPI